MAQPCRHAHPAAPFRRLLVCVALILAFASPAAAQQPQALRTAAEESGFTRHTSHQEMMDYLLALRASSNEFRLSSYGESRDGRTLPYLIFSRPMVTQPWEAALLGKPIIALNGNVHGGERTLRESLLVLIRDLATPGTPENRLLDDMVILVAPQINPDGFSATPGGTRGNAWGIDLNRDYIKLEHPEIANYVGNIINTWHPHLFVDGHNGGAFPYNINYQCPSLAAADRRITLLCDEKIFPFIDQRLRENGFKSWFYSGGTETRWNTGGYEARIGRNYGGLTNAVGILFESPGGQDMATGVRSGVLAFKATLDWVRANTGELVTTVARARGETIAMGLAAQGEVVVEMRYGPEDRRVQYEIARGQGADRRIIQVTSDSLMMKPIAVKTRPRPFAYVLPREAVAAVAMLRRHNITVEQLQDSLTLEVQAYTVDGVDYARVYDHEATVQVRVGEVQTIRRNFPRGTYVVPTGQILGRVVSHMLEAETDDNVIYWNTMDALLPRPRLPVVASGAAAGGDPEDEAPMRAGPLLVPIFKLMTPRPLPSRIIP